MLGELRILCATVAILAGGVEAAPIVALETHGGDAWTFELRISGEVSGGTCDRVELRSQSATIDALQVDGRFVAEVPLLAGDNTVQAICLQQTRVLARSQLQHWRVPLADIPKAWIRTHVDEEIVGFDAGRTETAPATPAPIVRFEWRARQDNPAPLQLANGALLSPAASVEGERIVVASPARDGEYYVRLQVTDAVGRSDESTAVFRVIDGLPHRVDLRSEHPTWVDRAVVYGATPYMFEPQTFRGIRQRLDEIASLGATALWLSPLTDAPDDDFGYAVTDHFTFRERFGSAEEFRRLVQDAHRLGLRVLVDFVPNHVSGRHRYFQNASQDLSRSPYYDWFERNEQGEPTQYFDWSHLKNLDFDNPEVQTYIIEAFSRFVRDFGVDGFRVDASWAVAERAPEFWPRLRAELKRIDPDIFLLAEASARESYHVANGFDAAYDWTANLGEWAWRDVFDRGKADLSRLRVALTNTGKGFPPDSLILRFLNNNDTGERFASRHGVPMARVAATMLFTLPGIPLIYNGDEMAARFEPYDEGPPLQWDDDHPLADHYRMLASLRARVDALISRELRLVYTTHEDAVLAFLRPGDRGVLVLLNFSERSLTVRPGDRDSAATFRRFEKSRDLLTGKLVNLSSMHPSVEIGAYSALVLGKR